MEFRSSLTLKPFDVITIPGLGTKLIGAINQTGHDRYQLRLDEKFVESVTVDITVRNGEQRSPERHEGPWCVLQQTRTPAPDPQRERWLDAVAQEALLAGLEGRPFTMPAEPEQDTHAAAPGDKHLSDAELAAEWWKEVEEHTRTAAQVLYEKTALDNPHVTAHFSEVGERCNTLHRFASRPFDEEVQAHLVSPDSATLSHKVVPYPVPLGGDYGHHNH